MSEEKKGCSPKGEDCGLQQETAGVTEPEDGRGEAAGAADAGEMKERENTEEASDDPIRRIESMYEHLSEQISSLEQLFDKRIMHAEYEDKIIDQMHEELQRYKKDLYSQLVRPILLDIIEIRDSIIRNAAIYLEKPEGEQDIPNKVFEGYTYDLQDILEKNNVEIYRSKRGEPYMPGRQSAVRREATNDETLHGKIAESLSGGYCYGGRVVSAEKVSVFFYEKMEESENESEDDING